jgi:hypothetical protein
VHFTRLRDFGIVEHKVVLVAAPCVHERDFLQAKVHDVGLVGVVYEGVEEGAVSSHWRIYVKVKSCKGPKT